MSDYTEITDHYLAKTLTTRSGWLARFWYEDAEMDDQWFWFSTKKAAIASLDPKGERIELWRLSAVPR